MTDIAPANYRWRTSRRQTIMPSNGCRWMRAAVSGEAGTANVGSIYLYRFPPRRTILTLESIADACSPSAPGPCPTRTESALPTSSIAARKSDDMKPAPAAPRRGRHRKPVPPDPAPELAPANAAAPHSSAGNTRARSIPTISPRPCGNRGTGAPWAGSRTCPRPGCSSSAAAWRLGTSPPSSSALRTSASPDTRRWRTSPAGRWVSMCSAGADPRGAGSRR